jgi:hypothetical protein
MPADRRAILHLVALGRITPAEAERLLAAWNEGRESLLALTGCILIACLAQLHLHELLPGAAHAFHSLGAGNLLSLHTAQSLVTHLLRGVL